MKKNLFVYILIIALVGLTAIFIFRPKNNDNLKKIKVAEVAHSVFYTPQYVAHALGYFKDEGLDVEITLSQGADAVMSAVLSGDADIGFCGTEATI